MLQLVSLQPVQPEVLLEGLLNRKFSLQTVLAGTAINVPSYYQACCIHVAKWHRCSKSERAVRNALGYLTLHSWRERLRWRRICTVRKWTVLQLPLCSWFDMCRTTVGKLPGNKVCTFISTCDASS